MLQTYIYMKYVVLGQRLVLVRKSRKPERGPNAQKDALTTQCRVLVHRDELANELCRQHM